MFKTFDDTGYEMDPNGKFIAITSDGAVVPFREWAHAQTWINFKLKDKPNLEWEIKYNAHPQQD